MTLTETEKKLAKRLSMLLSVLTLAGILMSLASADGAQRQKTTELDRRVTGLEAKTDNVPADIAAIKASLESIDARLSRIEAKEDGKR